MNRINVSPYPAPSPSPKPHHPPYISLLALSQLSGRWEGSSIPANRGKAETIWTDCYLSFQPTNTYKHVFSMAGKGMSMWKNEPIPFEVTGTLNLDDGAFELDKTHMGKFTNTVTYHGKLYLDQMALVGEYKDGTLRLYRKDKPGQESGMLSAMAPSSSSSSSIARLPSSLSSSSSSSSSTFTFSSTSSTSSLGGSGSNINSIHNRNAPTPTTTTDTLSTPYQPLLTTGTTSTTTTDNHALLTLLSKTRIGSDSGLLTGVWDGRCVKNTDCTTWTQCYFIFTESSDKPKHGTCIGSGKLKHGDQVTPVTLDGHYADDKLVLTVTEGSTKGAPCELFLDSKTKTLIGSYNGGVLELKRHDDLPTSSLTTAPHPLLLCSPSSSSSSSSHTTGDTGLLLDEGKRRSSIGELPQQQQPQQLSHSDSRQLDQYKIFLRGLLAADKLNKEQVEAWSKFCDDYGITDAQHTAALAELSVKPDHFEALKLQAMEEPAEDFTCKICYDAKIDCVLLPCGHFTMCLNCSKGVDKCPVCRQSITERKLVYRS